LAAELIGMVVNCTGCGLDLMTGVVVQKRLQDTSHCIAVSLPHHNFCTFCSQIWVIYTHCVFA